MAKKKASKSIKKSAAPSWWGERSKILAPVAKTAKPKSKKKAKAKKAKLEKAEKGSMYYCEVCGAEIVCVSPGAGELICCEEPMCLVC